MNPKTLTLITLAAVFLGFAALKIWLSVESARLCLELLKDGEINDRMSEICSQVGDDINRPFNALLEIAAAGTVGAIGATAFVSRSSRDNK